MTSFFYFFVSLKSLKRTEKILYFEALPFNKIFTMTLKTNSKESFTLTDSFIVYLDL